MSGRTPSAPGRDPSTPGLRERLSRLVLGGPRDLADRSLFHQLSLVPFLAWVGLGADGLSSSSYGPQESFLALGEHRFLAVALAVATTVTVAVIATAYSRIIRRFPHGGGGYVVASRLLGAPAGVLSGSALLVDYVLTVTVSIAAAGDALFSFLPPEWAAAKLSVEAGLVVLLTLMNLRGVRETVIPLVPVFLVFLGTHLALILAGSLEHAADAGRVAADLAGDARASYGELGLAGLLALFARAWSLGGGTYTGIEAVSNGLPILREPRVRTGRRTMLYMAVSLAFTAAGLLVCYLLVDVRYQEGMTLNAVLARAVFGDWPGGQALAVVTLVSEGALLVVAAQAGFLDGPRVLANMALDGWMPRRFASLSDRLTARVGIGFLGAASLVALLYTRGAVSALVVMYSINVFLTFSLSMLGMLRAEARGEPGRRRSPGAVALFATGLLLCAGILVVTVVEKFADGGWLTLLVTGLLVALCFGVRRHYCRVGALVARLDSAVSDLRLPAPKAAPKVDPHARTAVVLVGGYGGLGIRTVQHVVKEFEGLYRNLVFLSVGVVDPEAMKDEEHLAGLRERTESTVRRYQDLAHRLGLASAGRWSVGTDVVDELESLCVAASDAYPHATFFAGQLVWDNPRWYHRLLHNETALELERRLLARGLTLVVVPRRVPGSAP